MKKNIIGRVEVVDLPQMELYGLEAKIDTGAYTSAIHYHHAEVIERNDKKVLHFTLLDPLHPDYNGKSFYYETFHTRMIKNSFGQAEERYVIKTNIKLFDDDIMTEFTLSDRGNLKFPLLLGRKLLNKHFIVDTSKTKLSQNKK